MPEAPQGEMAALALANARFWPTVAPTMWRSLAGWRATAETIEDPSLRELALRKLAEEAFNAEVAATLATLAPYPQRSRTTQAIVALEVLFDYLDGRTEPLAASAPGETRRLLAAMPSALDPAAGAWKPFPAEADEAYLQALREAVAGRVATLPGFPAARATALAASTRCAEAQIRLHAAAHGEQAPLERWARDACAGSGLDWREYIGGCASSVLAVHALIASAATPTLTPEQAAATDSAYLAIGALITLLDSAVDETGDLARGEQGYIRLFAPEERAERGGALTREALLRLQALPRAAHHAMTLAGVVAYYASHPGAGDPAARVVVAAVRDELGPSGRAPLAVLRAWRAAKAIRRRLAPAPRPRHQSVTAYTSDKQT